MKTLVENQAVGTLDDHVVTVLKLKPIPNLEGYLAGDDGNIWSNRCRWGERPKPRRLVACPDRDRYLRVTIRINLKKKQFVVHRLVAMAFHGLPAPNQPETLHANGVRTDNKPNNLSWGNQKQNAEDRKIHGHTAQGQANGVSKLSDSQVNQIKLRLASGDLQKHIAKEFGLHKTAISHIATGRNWKWLQAQP